MYIFLCVLLYYFWHLYVYQKETKSCAKFASTFSFSLFSVRFDYWHLVERVNFGGFCVFVVVFGSKSEIVQGAGVYGTHQRELVLQSIFAHRWRRKSWEGN